jgi:hypothetical protein
MPRFQQRKVHAWTLVLATLALAGCSSNPKGPERTAKAVESFRDTRQHLADASKQVGVTNESLRKLTVATGGDLRPMFNAYAENVRKTQDMAKGARERADSMRKKTDAYTAQWQKEFNTISDPELRRKSEQRVASAKADFEKVRNAAEDVKTAYKPYMQGLQDVQQYLTNDLTAEGLQSVGNKANDTISKGGVLQQRIVGLQNELNNLEAKWSSKLGASSK